MSKDHHSVNSEVEWTIKNWNSTHKIIVAAKASCHFDRLGVSFFLRPKEDIMSVGNQAFVLKSYSLWAEKQGYFGGSAIKVTATVRSGTNILLTRGNKRKICSKCSVSRLDSKSININCDFISDGTIGFDNSDEKVVEVIDRFISSESRSLGSDGVFTDVRVSPFLNWPEITINIKTEIFHLN